MKFSQQLFFIVLLPLIALGQKDSINEINPYLKDRLMIKAGLFIPSRNIAVGANGSIINDLIDFDETFNFTDNESTLFLQINWKFSRNRKWMLSGEFFRVNNGNSVPLDKDIEFENITFEKGTFVRAGIEFGLYRVVFSSELISRPRHHLGVGLGSHLFNVGAFIEGEVKTSQGDREFQKKRVSALVPLPNVGTYYYFAPHSKWVFGARVDWFGLSVGDYSGSLWNVAPQVNFQIFRNFGIGLDYRFFFVNAKVSQENWNGGFEMDFSGPLFSLHGNF